MTEHDEIRLECREHIERGWLEAQAGEVVDGEDVFRKADATPQAALMMTLDSSSPKGHEAQLFGVSRAVHPTSRTSLEALDVRKSLRLGIIGTVLVQAVMGGATG